MKFKTHLIKLTQQSKHPRSLHAALVAKGKRVLGQSANTLNFHAEDNALFLARKQELKGATLYTLMVRKKSGTLGNGSPCASCMNLIKASGLKKVVVYV